MALFQVCPVCGSQQNIEPYDFCQTCGHEWESVEIMSSTPIPRPTTGAVDLGDSSAFEVDSMPVVLSAGQGESTPAPNH